MPIPEAVEVDDEEYGAYGPPPPPRGSREYRRLLLRVIAAQSKEEYEEASAPLIVHNGWRGSVDLIIETMHLIGKFAPDRCVDAFGKVHLDDEFERVDEETQFDHATELASKIYPELPPHEALRRTLETGEKVWSTPERVLPAWNECATVLRREGMEGYEAARVILTRWLNEHHRDERVVMGAVTANVTHTTWRTRLPIGHEWIEEVLDDGPDLSGSLAWSRDAEPAHVNQLAPGVFDRMMEDGAKEAKRLRKRKSKFCSCCGRKRA